jgi:uridine kinase
LARQLAALAGSGCICVIELDSYYRCQAHIPLEERITKNYDHPSEIEFELLNAHLDALKAGNPIELPSYDFCTHTRRSGTPREIHPKEIVIVEGILALTMPEVRYHFNTKVFVDAPESLRLSRRMQRDIHERGRTQESVHAQWHGTVQPMHTLYCEPCREFADLVVDGADQSVKDVWDYLLGRVYRTPRGSDAKNSKV